MKSNLLFDFIVDKKNNTIHIKKEFRASRDLVWATWTEPELLDQWWAPQPWKSVTKSMDFSVGGRRLYTMEGPEGEEFWNADEYLSITPTTNFKHRSIFCDNQGNENKDFPSSIWNINFLEQNELTTVKVDIKHKTFADLEQIIKMGFKEGITSTLHALDNLFINLNEQ